MLKASGYCEELHDYVTKNGKLFEAFKGRSFFITGAAWLIVCHGVLSNRNMVDYATVQSDECPNRTARPKRPFPDGPAAARL